MNIPKQVQNIINKIRNNKFEACIVGGCVRDLLLNREPKDWDITTNATPDEILKIFPDGKYTNRFGTVLVKNDEKEVFEVTTYRSEGLYTDKRRPDQVFFEKTIDKDLSRRDFTINALALMGKENNTDFLSNIDKKYLAIFDKYCIIDLFGGINDLNNKIIKAVDDPIIRFEEDALRMIRAIRFAVELNFKIEENTQKAIIKTSNNITMIANERVRDEFIKILKSDNPYNGIMLLQKMKLLQYILPELEAGVGVTQNKHHIYTVFEHNTLSLKYCPSKDWRVRFASLVHDIGKVQTKKIIKGEATFYNHEYASANMVRRIAKRLKFTNKDKEKIVLLVKNHMFYYNVDEVTEASVRRLIKKVGKENLSDLMDVRIADRLGSGVPKAKPYKLRHLEYMIKKVQKDPVSVKMLKINGNDLIKKLNIEPGPKIGAILDILLSEVIENPKLNNKEKLEKRSNELKNKDYNQLRKIARDIIKNKKKEDDNKIKKEFYVK